MREQIPARTKITCDRCGVKSELDYSTVNPFTTGAVTLYNSTTESGNGSFCIGQEPLNKYDLCPTCTKDFEKFLKQKEGK